MTKQSNLKIILYSALVTLNMWAGDQVVKGVSELEKSAVKAAAEAYVDYRFPVAEIPDSNTKYEKR